MSDTYINKKIETAVGTFVKTSPNMGVVTYRGRTDVSLNELKYFLNQVYELMEFRHFYLINDLTNHYGNFNNEIWRFLASDKTFNTTILHSIVVSTSLAMKIQLNFFLKILKPSYKVTQVNSMKKALLLVDKLETISI